VNWERRHGMFKGRKNTKGGEKVRKDKDLTMDQVLCSARGPHLVTDEEGSRQVLLGLVYV